ncbi:hypothetical protein D3C84_640090 [compost metagenome]
MRRVELVTRFQFGRWHADNTFDGVQRNRVLLVTVVNHQAPVDRHGERQANQEARALARVRLDHHRTAKLLDLFMDHVHAQAPPGYLGNFLGGGEPRLEDELHHLMVAEDRRGVEQATLDRLAPHRVQWHTGAVVGHFNDDISAFVQQGQ